MMSGSALALAEAPSADLSEAPTVAATAPTPLKTKLPLSVLVLSPREHPTDPIAALVREALPGDGIIRCGDAGQALAQAEKAHNLGRAPALFVFDFRGLPAVAFQPR